MSYSPFGKILLTLPLFVLFACEGCTVSPQEAAKATAIADSISAAEEARKAAEEARKAEEEGERYADAFRSLSSEGASDATAAEEEVAHNVVQLHTGDVPFRNHRNLSGTGENEIVVNARQSNSNYVVLVKKGGRLVANVYIEQGHSHAIRLPNGTYQVYFYAGRQWATDIVNKGQEGGFINGAFTKDERPLELYGARMTYTLYGVENGNFNPAQSDSSEAL